MWFFRRLYAQPAGASGLNQHLLSVTTQTEVGERIFIALLSKTARTLIGGARGMGLEGPDLAKIGVEVSMVINGRLSKTV